MRPTVSGMGGLREWLGTLNEPALLELLRARPDAARAPAPRDLGELAERLGGTQSIAYVRGRLSLPALQVVEALLALGGTAERAELLDLLGAGPGTAHRVDEVLDELSALALVHPVGSAVHVAGGWRRLVPRPLGLGRPARTLFGLLTVAQLTRIGEGLGVHDRTGKQQWVSAVGAAAADPHTVAARLERAGPEVAAVVRRIAEQGPQVGGAVFPSRIGTDPDEVGTRLVVEGWVVPTEWGRAEMPAEVALAVRGPGRFAPFDTAPPSPATAPIHAARLRDAGLQAAGAAVQAVRRLVGLLDRAPLGTIQAGGVGVRELRRAARELGTDEAGLRLWLETAAAAGLVAVSGGSVLAYADVDGWLETDPAHALARLLLGWWRLPHVPGHRLDGDKPVPALTPAFRGAGPLLRADVLDELRALPAGRGLVDAGELARLLDFRRAGTYGGPHTAEQIRATTAEATRLGLVSDGAITPLGAGLLSAVATDDPATALAASLAGQLPPQVGTVTLLPDLTAVVTGAPALSLARLLDGAADAESRDTASTWRFTPASVRRALDAGRTADMLLADITAVAEHSVPQPLEYLVRDVARRHGQMQVVATASCIRVADAALGAELAAHRGLAELDLRLLADTVLASGRPAIQTLAALREAGYAPVHQDVAGEVVIERAPVRRAEPRLRAAERGGAALPDLPALAARLCGGGPAPPPAVDDRVLADDAPQLEPGALAVLTYAVEHRSPVWIAYVDPAGIPSTRVIEPRVRLFGTLVAWCREERADRDFALDRITDAVPVPE